MRRQEDLRYFPLVYLLILQQLCYFINFGKNIECKLEGF